MATTSDKSRVSVALAMEVRWKGRSSMRIAEDTADHYDEQGLHAITSSPPFAINTIRPFRNSMLEVISANFHYSPT